MCWAPKPVTAMASPSARVKRARCPIRRTPRQCASCASASPESSDQELRDENYAAAMMAVENLSIAAVEMGLGTHIKTGAIMADPAARAAARVRDGERIVAVVNVGEPAEAPPPKQRQAARAFTTWVP